VKGTPIQATSSQFSRRMLWEMVSKALLKVYADDIDSLSLTQ